MLVYRSVLETHMRLNMHHPYSFRSLETSSQCSKSWLLREDVNECTVVILLLLRAFCDAHHARSA